MESKKFVNLPKNYREYLYNCDKIINIDINDMIDLISLNNLHKEIENLLINYDLQISDINHFIQNYDKENEIINKIKKLIYYRNFNLIKLILRSSIWKNFIINIKSKIDRDLTIKQIENGVIKLFEKYIGTWNTIDKYIKIKKNEIKEIEIIDPDDYKYIFNYEKI